MNAQISSAGPDFEALPPSHPIASVISTYVHELSDIKWCGGQYIPDAAEATVKRLREAIDSMEKAQSLIDGNDIEKVHGINALKKGMRSLDRHQGSSLSNILSRSLFIALFSSFDAFVGDILAALFKEKPGLLESIEKTITVSELLTFPTIDAAKKFILEAEIEALRRKSYSDQFQTLESKFSINTLRKFENWPAFIERSQRRNLLTHCGGVASDQYRSVCIKNGVPEDKLPKTGEKIDLEPDYYFESCELLIEVVIKLGQTLWRKVLPKELHQADEQLSALSYDALLVEQWSRAKMIADFALQLPRIQSDLTRRIIIINRSIAIKALGDRATATRLLQEHDWSATILEFQLAVEVLNDNFSAASEIMVKIGKEGTLITESGYHDWPLFRDFRTSSEFQKSYEHIYSHPFAAKLQEEATQAITTAQHEIYESNA